MKRLWAAMAVTALMAAWLSVAPGAAPQAPAAAGATPADSRTWIGQAATIEDYLRTVPLSKFEDLSVGVTKPKRAFLPEGGPMKYLVWKVIPPGRYAGYWESYQNEIAAYEMDKLLGLNMVPPTVDRTYRGEHGAAIMWVSSSKSFKDMGGTGAPTPPPALADSWARQLVKAKMFHNLINDIDPNLGNWLVDPAWDLILIDFSRCFTPGTGKMPHQLTRVDPDLWARMKALTEPQLTQALGKLIGKGEIRGIVQRRDQLQLLIDKLVKEHGESYVYMKDVGR
jgi:hypothetical protein